MLKMKLRETPIKTTKLKHHKRIYFVNKAKLNYTLNKMGMFGKFNFSNEDLKEFLFKHRLLYTEFLEHISDGFKCF